MKIPESLRPILRQLKKVRYSHGDCWRARCVCGSDELRIFVMGREARCSACGMNTFGLEQFLERFMGDFGKDAPSELPEAKSIVVPGKEAPPEEDPNTEVLVKTVNLEGKEGGAWVEAPEPKKATLGSCEYCGEPFEILPYTRRKKRFCSGKHQKAMERHRKKNCRNLETGS